MTLDGRVTRGGGGPQHISPSSAGPEFTAVTQENLHLAVMSLKFNLLHYTVKNEGEPLCSCNFKFHTFLQSSDSSIHIAAFFLCFVSAPVQVFRIRRRRIFIIHASNDQSGN